MSLGRTSARVFRKKILVEAVTAACLSLSIPLACAADSCTTGATTISGVAIGPCHLYAGDSLAITPSGSIGTLVAPQDSYGVMAASGDAVGAINNQGNIYSTIVGIALSNAASGTALSNSGTISASAFGNPVYGIGLWNNGVISGAVLNDASGVIRVEATGNRYANAIHLSSSSINSLTNNGTIAAIAATRNAKGILVLNSGTIGSLVNNGTIAASAAASDAEGISLSLGGSIGSLTNNGNISATATSGDALGVSLFGSSSMVGGIVNGGVISGVSSGASGFGIFATAGSNLGGVTNNAGGTIRGNTYSLFLQNSISPFAVDNSGTLDGAIYLGINTLNLNGTGARVIGDTTDGIGGTVNVNGAFSAEGNFTVSNFNIASSGVFNAGNRTLAITNGVANGGVFAVGAGNTATVTGNYTQSESGTFRTGVTNGTTYGKLVVNGTATLAANAKIDVDVATPSLVFTTARMKNIISATTLASDGTFSVSDNSLLFNFGAVKNGNSVDLTLTPAAPAALDSVMVLGNTPAIGAAAVLDRVITQDTSGGLASHFLALTSQQQVSNAVSQTLPLMTGGTTAAAQSVQTNINHIVQARVDGTHGLSSGDDFLGDKSFWLKPFGSRTVQNERDGVSGYIGNTSGLIIGADGAWSATLRLGAAFAYANIDLDGQSSVAPQSATVDAYQLLGYGSYDLDERTTIDFRAGLGRNTTKGRRQINFASSVASSNYHSDTGHAGLGLGRTYQLNDRTSLTPSVRADYLWVKDHAYSETGADSLNLNVKSQTTDAFLIGSYNKLAHRLNDQTTLIADLGVAYDTINERASITSAFSGAPEATFVTFGAKPSPWIALGGAGAVYQTKSGVEIAARYDVEYRQSFLNQTASLKASWPF